MQPDGDEAKDEPATNRFSAVIEKIERLYMVCNFSSRMVLSFILLVAVV